MISYSALCQAARLHDDLSTGGADDAIIEANLDPDDAWRFAEQRALRLVLIASGQQEMLEQIIESSESKFVKLTQNQQFLLKLAKIGVMDGLCISQRV